MDDKRKTNPNLTYLESSGGLLLNATSIITGRLLSLSLSLSCYVILYKKSDLRRRSKNRKSNSEYKILNFKF